MSDTSNYFNTLKFLGVKYNIMVRGNKLFVLAYEASLALESWLIQECHSADKIYSLFPFNTASSLNPRQQAQTIGRVFTIAIIKIGIEQRIHKYNASFNAEMLSQSKISAYQDFSVQLFGCINEHPTESTKKIEAIFINIIREINQISTEQAQKILPSHLLNLDFLMKLIKATQEQAPKTQGVVYTPDYVCQFIFSGLNCLLNQYFTESGGLHGEKLLFYDPAVGPLTFEVNLWAYLSNLHNRDSQKEDLDFIKIFKRFYGNEIDPAVIMIGVLENMHKFPVSPQDQKNFQLISNISVRSALTPDFSQFLSQNPDYRDKYLLIFGNPPYSVSSSNKDPWIYALMKDYAVDEPNITRIYDDYIKFIRYAQYLLEEHGQGVVGYITNRKFLDGKIFYGMRRRLCEVYTAIYIEDLLGDSRNIKHSKESLDNIFGIQTGIAIVFFVKQKGEANSKVENRGLCPVYYAKVTGTAAEVEKMLQNGFGAQHFEKLTLLPPKYLLIPREAPECLAEFWESKCWPITSVFQDTSRAMISSRDNFMIHVDRAPLFANLDLLEKGDFKTLRLQERIRKGVDPLLENPQTVATFNFGQMQESIIPINYRAFDLRHSIFYTINRRCGKSIILDHLNLFDNFWLPCREKFKENPGFHQSDGCAINFVQSVQKPPFSHVFITQGVVDSGLFGYSTSKVAPLYIVGVPNLSSKFIEQIERWKPKISPLELFGYIYGSFFSNVYSAAFEPFLLHEFPKVILPPNRSFLDKIAAYGSHLMQLHCYKLQADEYKKAIDSFNTSMEQNFEPRPLVRYEYNPDTLILHFEAGIGSVNNTILKLSCPTSTYRYKIGSVSVISHWLDARLRTKLERNFSKDDLWQLLLTITILEETLVIRKKIDDEYFTHFPVLVGSAYASEFDS
jgi:predicted helicase